jgi:GNAT superfamily N-acetyltransferase
VIRELRLGETHLAAEAMLALRPHLGSSAEFVRLVDEVQRPQGYRLIAFFVKAREQAVATAGFRVIDYLAWGHALYCDDLSTLPDQRGHGYAAALLDWMIDEARRLGCGEFHLDSGVGADRESAHRLYFNKRMRISSYHFSRKV